jgi:hypothetical protein
MINVCNYFYNNLKLMEEGQHIELNYKEIDSLEREFQQVNWL